MLMKNIHGTTAGESSVEGNQRLILQMGSMENVPCGAESLPAPQCYRGNSCTQCYAQELLRFNASHELFNVITVDFETKPAPQPKPLPATPLSGTPVSPALQSYC